MARGNGSVLTLKAPSADELLARFAQGGHEEAFAEVVRRYAAMVFAVCLRVTKNAHDADDATQMTFLTLAVQIRSGKPVSRLGPWLQQVAKRAALDVHRSRKRRVTHEQRHADGFRHVASSLERSNGRPDADRGEIDLEKLNHVLAEELGRLPAKYRMPLVSLYFGNLSREEIAKELGCTIGTLGVRIHRGRQILARRLSERGVAPAARLATGGLLAAAIATLGREALVRRATEAAARVATGGGDIATTTAANVLAALKSAAMASVMAKVKVVAVVAVLAGITAFAGGASGQWPSLEARLSQVARRAIDWIGSRSVPSLPRFAPRNVPVPVAGAAPTPPTTKTSAAITPTPIGPTPADVRASPRPAPYPTVSPARVASAEPAPRTAAGAPPTPAPASARPATEGLRLPAPRAPRPTAIAGAVPRPAATLPELPPGPSGDVSRDNDGTRIAAAAGSRGAFVHDGGVFRTPTLDVGRSGSGQFIQRGGVSVIGGIALGTGAGGQGAYSLDDGQLVISRAPFSAAHLPGTLNVGGDGQGMLHLGGDHTGGAIFQPRGPLPAGDSLVVRGGAGGSGAVDGWGGAIGDGGAFVQNGQVVADGENKNRALLFLGYNAVTSTIENPTHGGTNGWFARNGGRLILPKIPVAAGTNTYTWGENPADPTIDLVNSVRVTLHDAKAPGKIDISLLDKARAEVPALPSGHTFIGIWAFDPGLTRPAGVDLTVRYDDGLAASLGLSEGVLKLWRYDSGQWVRINDGSFVRDMENHLLSGHADQLSYFAVSAPEPSAVALLLFGGTALLRRRRQELPARTDQRSDSGMISQRMM